MRIFLFVGFLSVSLALGVSACTKKKSKTVGTPGEAKVALDDANGFTVSGKGRVSTNANTCPASNTCATSAQLAKFEIKLMSVGIHTEADTNTGYGSAIYVDAACPSPSLQTEIDEVLYDYIGFGSCSDADITTYIDLKSATVNDTLNSQYLPIAPGTYKYGVLTFCQGGASADNYRVTFNNDGSLPAELRGQVVNISVGTCGVTSPEMSPAMEVSSGESVLVTLNYDLTNTVYYRSLGAGETAGTACSEVDNGGTRYSVCINPPTIGATFATQEE